MALFIRLLDPLIYAIIKRWGVPKDGIHPRWWCWLVDRSFDLWAEREWEPRMMAADAAGQGLTSQWWPPTTDPATILTWYDEQIHQARSPLPGLNWFGMFLIRCTMEEAAYAQTTGAALPADHLLVAWTGPRATWWTEGRPQLQAMLMTEHTGLYTVVNSAAAIHQAAMPSLQRPHEST